MKFGLNHVTNLVEEGKANEDSFQNIRSSLSSFVGKSKTVTSKTAVSHERFMDIGWLAKETHGWETVEGPNEETMSQLKEITQGFVDRIERAGCFPKK